jgi:uncharacterized iron-regulated membrane protein
MRTVLVLLHRWFGLGAALFLFIAGVTGAVISWGHELDAWLNPAMYASHTAGTPQPPLDLAARIESADPRVRVTYLPLAVTAGEALKVSVAPRVNPATGELQQVDYNEVAIDPVSGQIQGKRLWGAISLSRENLLPFLHRLHYSMLIPESGGIEWGTWLMGIIGVVWVLDSFIALWLSFPNRTSWRKSFAFRLNQGGPKLNFDLHRSGGIWMWFLVLTLAVTSVSMNLGGQVTRPIVSWFSTLSESPFARRTPVMPQRVKAPKITALQAIALARTEAARRGWRDPAGAIFYSAEFDLFSVGFFAPGKDHGDGGLGNPWLYFDAQTGAAAAEAVPGTGSAGDIFMQAQFPLHSGRIIGIPGRILISIMGLLIAMLSVTGVVIWARKRRASQSRLAVPAFDS